MKTVEVNFDGLVGPTHNYAGIARGNTASMRHAHQVSNPKAAALQGLKKMRLMMDLNLPQAVLPPQVRPDIIFLRSLGFRGHDIEVLQSAYKLAPEMFRIAYSASSMWAANAATVSPSADSQDKRVHITPANLITHLHRMQEFEFNYKLFKSLFSNEEHFVIHKPLPSHLDFADEGAANHNRLCDEYGIRGLQLFVYGRSSNKSNSKNTWPQHFPARQTLEASEALSRLHQLSPENIIFAKQNPLAIDKGVFHNDVISVANQNVFLYHKQAFEETEKIVWQLKKQFSGTLHLIAVSESELSLEDSVRTYLFNSQLITISEGAMALIAPEECRTNPNAHQALQHILSLDNPIQFLYFVDCSQSMQNGGGPACLRLRIVLTEQELKACHQSVFLNETLYQNLVSWVEKHYRDRIVAADLLDPELVQEIRTALEDLSTILNIKNLYDL